MVALSTAGSCKSFHKKCSTKNNPLPKKATLLRQFSSFISTTSHKHYLQIGAKNKFHNTAIQTIQVTLSFSRKGGPRLG